MRLLKRLLPTQDIDALLGDIAEESRRRSWLWYWSQVVAAIVVGSWREARKHPFLAVRAVAIGLATLTIYFSIAAAIARVISLTLPSPFGELAFLFVNALGFSFSGWTIVRLHRPHGVAMAMPFLVIMTLLALIPLTIVVTDTGPGTRTMPIVQMVCTFGTMFSSIPGGVFLGGVLGTQRS